MSLPVPPFVTRITFEMTYADSKVAPPCQMKKKTIGLHRKTKFWLFAADCYKVKRKVHEFRSQSAKI